MVLGGALLALSLLGGLSLSGSAARAGPSSPGENGKIACAGPKDRTLPNPNDEDDFELYSVNPDGTGLAYLTDNTGNDPASGFFVDDFDPVYSPDGKKIAFESFRTGSSEIHTMNADGTEVRRLTIAEGEDRAGGWSPDGARLVFHSARSGDVEVYTMNSLDGSDVRRLTFSRGIDAIPSWSPDGRRIAFNSARDDRLAEIYTMTAEGTDIRRLTSNPPAPGDPTGVTGNDAAAVWSPDGSQLAFRSGRDGEFEIYRMNADGSAVTRLTGLAPTDPATPPWANQAEDFPAWSPDGTSIAFNSNRSGDTEVYTMSAAEGDRNGVTRVTEQPGFDGRCDWQPIPRAAVAPPPALASGACANPKSGTDRDDNLVGTIAGDRIDALGGHDRVDGLQGDDCLTGARGRDRLAGALGNDRLSGGADRDSLSGSGGVDSLSGGQAKDKLNGGGNRDTLAGGSGPDQLSGASDNDRLSGGAGDDRLAGGTGRNRYSAGAGNDRVLAANGHTERINCGSGRRDTALTDRRDRVRGCERVRRLR